MSPFDFVTQIQRGKKNLLDAETEKNYLPFIVNRSLSYHIDCLMPANEMNRYYDLPKRMQNDYLLGIIRDRRRPFEKWIKREESADIGAVMKFYHYSITKAREALKLLTVEQLDTIKDKVNVGGLKG